MINWTRAVADGHDAPDKLITGLKIALEHAEALARQLTDQTFVTDDGARTWQAATLQTLNGFRSGMQHMFNALQEPIDKEALLQGLDHAVAAEAQLRLAFMAVTASYNTLQQSLERSQQVRCVRCGHLNRAGTASCESCRCQLPNTGVERIEMDIIGGEPVRESAFLARLRTIIGQLNEPDGRKTAIDFLKNLEQLQTLAAQQLSALMQRHDQRHPAVTRTVELKSRIEGVRDMLNSVRQSLEAGDAGALQDLPSWLEREFDAMQQLKQTITEAASQS